MHRTGDKATYEIKFLLNGKGLTFSAVDRRSGLKEGTARAAARRPHKDGEAAIAAVLGLRPVDLWPSRYRSDGVRLEPQPAANYRTGAQFRKCQKRGACINTGAPR